jgi:hypothetical protein
MKFFHHIGQVERQKIFSYRNPPCWSCSEKYSFEVFNSCYWRNFLRNTWYRSCYISFDAETPDKSNDISYFVISPKVQKPEGKNLFQKHVFFGFSRFSQNMMGWRVFFFQFLKTWRHDTFGGIKNFSWKGTFLEIMPHEHDPFLIF